MSDSLDEIMARHEAATACGCCCNDDFCAYLDKTPRRRDEKPNEPLPASAASRRGSVRFLNERPAA